MTSRSNSSSRPASDLRVQFDAQVTFRNGGGLQVQGFRLDLDPALDRAEVDEPALAAQFVSELGLLMVDTVVLDRITCSTSSTRARARAAARWSTPLLPLLGGWSS